MSNSLISLVNQGQSIWLDYISRSLIEQGELKAFIDDDGVRGVTSNPSIFEKAIAKTKDYDQAINTLFKKTKDALEIYEKLAIKDIQDACDLLHATYEKTGGLDGFASLEVSPHLAFKTSETINEGRRLFGLVDRPNLMIKVPGTKEGMPAIRTLISEGINVNVTLLFAKNAYMDASCAYLLGLKDRLERGLSIDHIHSVASFFISRIDSKVDAKLEKMATKSSDINNKAQKLLGTIAIANAQVAYLSYLETYKSDLAVTLMKNKAHPQRLLWASTSTKNPRYSDVLYVESLIAHNTVNTMPLETLEAFKDHGETRDSFLENLKHAPHTLASLSALGIDFDVICQELLDEGVTLFINAFDQLIGAIKHRVEKAN